MGIQILVYRAEKYINDHCNPIVKVELFGSKLFLPSPDQDNQHVLQCLSRVETTLKHDRVDRRSARCKALWLPDQNCCTVKKIVGSYLANYGYQNKEGKFLTAEETVVLLETNKLELLYKNVPLSIQEAYKHVLDNCRGGLRNYLVYKKLILQGYKVTIPHLLHREHETLTKKRKKYLNEGEGPSTKLLKKVDVHGDSFTELFKKLQQQGPKSYSSMDYNEVAKYYVHFAKSRKSSPELNLIIKPTTEEFTSRGIGETSSDVYALCSDESKAFFQFVSSPIPNLL